MLRVTTKKAGIMATRDFRSWWWHIYGRCRSESPQLNNNLVLFVAITMSQPQPITDNHYEGRGASMDTLLATVFVCRGQAVIDEHIVMERILTTSLIVVDRWTRGDSLGRIIVRQVILLIQYTMTSGEDSVISSLISPSQVLWLGWR